MANKRMCFWRKLSHKKDFLAKFKFTVILLILVRYRDRNQTSQVKDRKIATCAKFRELHSENRVVVLF